MSIKLNLAAIGDIEVLKDAIFFDENRSLSEVLQEAPAFSVGVALDAKILATPIKHVHISFAKTAEIDNAALYAPPGIFSTLQCASGNASSTAITEPSPAPIAEPTSIAETPQNHDSAPPTVSNQHPDKLSEAETVAIAYQAEVKKLATFLRSRLSLLVTCEKLVVPYLWRLILNNTWVASKDGSQRETRLEPVLLELTGEADDANPMGGNNRMAKLRALIHELKPDQVLVIPNLDLLGGGGEKGLNKESRELTELIYGAQDRLVLAFVDPSLPVPEVIAARFPVRATVEGLERAVQDAQGKPIAIGTALVTASEAAMFQDFDASELYKNVSGLNPLRLREAIAYAVQVARDNGHSPANPAAIGELHKEVRAFKAQTAEQFIIPNVSFDHIGGYPEVKHTLMEAIALISGAGKLPDETLRKELVPRGFLFYGPPGTGKTLFAKAIANELNASVRIVSGPEVTDMYVGESERKVRAIFAEARRNAPAVIVFDEFDSIAGRRSGRDDGGSRAGNALVAQILTEMDGFRPDVPMLVIGTTNRLNLIDEALLRPSRFQPIAIDLPDPAARREIVRFFAKHFRIEIADDLVEIITKATQGMNGDEIRSLFRDACVGHYYKQPAEPADAHRLGFLVGRIRTRLDGQQNQGTGPQRGLGGRVVSNSPMISLTVTTEVTNNPLQLHNPG